jgi:hypothetical protein
MSNSSMLDAGDYLADRLAIDPIEQNTDRPFANKPEHKNRVLLVYRKAALMAS